MPIGPPKPQQGTDLSWRLQQLSQQLNNLQTQGLGAESLTPPGFQIDPSTGLVVYPGAAQASPSRASLSTPQSVGTSPATIALNSLDFAPTGVTLSAGVLTFQTAGIYYVIEQLDWTMGGLSSSNYSVSLELLHNGSAYSPTPFLLTGSYTYALTNLDMIQLAAGDTLAMAITSPAGTANTANSAGTRLLVTLLTTA